jgi:hypothetical protein
MAGAGGGGGDGTAGDGSTAGGTGGSSVEAPPPSLAIRRLRAKSDADLCSDRGAALLGGAAGAAGG